MKIGVCAFILISISSCVKEITLPGQSQATKMLVQSLIDNERPIRVFVTESSPVGGSTSINGIAGALVQLYKNDSLLQSLPYVFADSAKTLGVYQYTGFGIPGNKYSVKVSHPKYGVETGTDVLPKLPVVNSWQLIEYGDTSNQFIAKFRLQLQDDGADSNFYRINVSQEGQQFWVNGVNDTMFEHFELYPRPELSTILSDTIRDYDKYILFSNNNFKGQNKEIDLQFKVADLRNVVHTNLTVEIDHVSFAQYQYFKTVEQYREQSAGYQSAAVFSNIQNGYGIFMTQSIVPMTTAVK